MGYRIVYEKKRHQWDSGRNNAVRILIPAAVCALILVIGLCNWGQSIIQALLPGDAAVTAMALDDLAANLRQGLSLRQALEVFCRCIVENAGLQP